MKVDKEEQVSQMLKEAKIFVAAFDELISNLGEEEIKSHRAKISRAR